MRKVYKIKNNDVKKDGISYFSLYRYSTPLEKLAICISLLFSLISGCMLIAAIIVYGEISSLFIDRTECRPISAANYIVHLFGGSRNLINGTKEEHYLEIITDINAFGVASIVDMLIMLISSALSIFIINWAASNQITRIRYKFLENILRQDMSFFDTDSNLNFASKITDDLEKIKEGISEKVAMFGYLVNSVIVSCGLSFYYGWKLTLVGLSVVPLSILVNAITSKFQSKCSSEELETHSYAARCVEEVLSSIRTVLAFGGEQKEVDRYSSRLIPLESVGRKRSLSTAVGTSLGWFISYSLNSIIFYYGSKLIVDDRLLPLDERLYNPAILVIILYAVFNSAQNISMCSPHTETFATARGAAKQLFPLIEKKSKIDSLSDNGLKLKQYFGNIVLKDIYFNYPSRPDVKVLRGLNLAIKSGETVALVGESGCGKSTILQLIQRLYDPDSGKIILDGNNLKDINLHSYRSSIGVVGQEPVLFAGTIKDNIELGKPGATTEEIMKAAKKAYAHDFILGLHDGYDTLIGERGASLSGGQKQRIAIARSLIRDPKILLLDEATSALDSASEKEVQVALDEASFGRTTIVVTHRLSTIVNANRIVYLNEGVILEEGSHLELLEKKGHYYNLVQNDLITSTKCNGNVNTQLVKDDSISKEQIEISIRKIAHTTNTIPVFSRSGSLRKYTRNNEVDDLSVSDECKEEKSTKAGVSYWQLLKLNAPEWPWIAVGALCSFIIGGCLPLFAILFSEVFAMFKTDSDDELLSRAKYYSALFVCASAVCSLATFLQIYVFNIAGSKLTTRLRIETFRNFLKQEISWFDNPENSVGSLCARLSTDAAAVQGATGTRIGTILQSVSTVIIGMIVALSASWKLTLVSMLSMPVVIGAVYLEGVVSRVFNKREKRAMEGASSIATEAIMNIKTVQSMGIERELLERFSNALSHAKVASAQATRPRGGVYALGCAAPTLGFTIALYYGGWLISRGELEYHKSILVSEALIYGSWMLGQALSFAPNFNSAKSAGERIIQLMNRQTNVKDNENIDDKDWGNFGRSPLHENTVIGKNGQITYDGVSFTYPNRPDQRVLNGITLNIEKGKTTALVGHSGCGKSTVLQLLQRFYDVDGGTILLDNKNVITDLSLKKLRSQLGIVQQEPVLFDRTIAENIAYGDNSRIVTIEEITKAARAANIHTFIASLPSGYDTSIGARGAQLSGGQKQRIAIARALVRNPKVLLLDEATSALDAASEKTVQEALDEASKNRTCIVIAHRLATIQNADCIYVLDKGSVAEKGTHDELLNKNGLYYKLLQMQNT